MFFCFFFLFSYRLPGFKLNVNLSFSLVLLQTLRFQAEREHCPCDGLARTAYSRSFVCLFSTLYRLPGFKLSVNALLASLGPHTLGHLSVFSTLYRLPGFKLGVNALLTSLGPHTVVHLSVFFPHPVQTAWFQAECERLPGLARTAYSCSFVCLFFPPCTDCLVSS